MIRLILQYMSCGKGIIGPAILNKLTFRICLKKAFALSRSLKTNLVLVYVQEDEFLTCTK